MANAAELNRTLFIGDNLPILRGIDSESVDLIATDPPFNKGVKAFEGIVTAGEGREGTKVSYKDTWTWGDVQAEWTEAIKDDHPNLYAVIQAANAASGEDMGAFLCWLGVRVLEMHRILKPTGSLYLHVDHTAGAWVKAMLDAIMSKNSFRNEIIWHFPDNFQGNVKRFASNSNTILFYAGGGYTFNHVYVPLDKPKKRGGRVWDKETGRVVPQRDADGNPVYQTYTTKKVDNVWTIGQSGVTNRGSKERTGYPTQKPLALYERIINASSNEGDIVLDPFAGCATTCVAAERLGREWIAIDINAEAEAVVRQRLEKEARLPIGTQSWDRAIQVHTTPPARTDSGAPAAPELTLVSPRAKAPRLTAKELRERLMLDDGLRCQGCGWIPHHADYMEVDHRIPKSREGRDDLRNRVLLCSPCNGVKGNKLTLAELRLRRIEEGRMADTSWDMAWYERTGRFG